MKDNINLLEETIEYMNRARLAVSDIIFIGCGTQECTWEEFVVLANRVYDCGYGGAEVDEGLTIGFSDGGQMRRWEYDGSERWEYIAPFRRPTTTTRLTSVFYEEGR